jgi:hypothetical protein
MLNISCYASILSKLQSDTSNIGAAAKWENSEMVEKTSSLALSFPFCQFHFARFGCRINNKTPEGGTEWVAEP